MGRGGSHGIGDPVVDIRSKMVQTAVGGCAAEYGTIVLEVTSGTAI